VSDEVADTLSITRRKPNFGTVRAESIPAGQRTFDFHKARNVSDLQSLSQQFIKEQAENFPIALWRVLGAVLEQSKQTQSKVLEAVAPLLSTRDRKTWPTTRAALDYQLAKNGCLSARWRRTVSIDLSHIGLSKLKDPISFNFVDPVFAWASCAERLSHKHPLHFTYRERVHPHTGEKMYGSSVQHGEFMKEACRRTPTSPGLQTGPALFGLSWDAGNATKRRSYTPILISVGNTDYAGWEVCYCIGYMPVLGLSEKELSKPAGKQAMHELRQQCARAIIDVIEAAAQTGFKCQLSTGR
jgi:hypothetical protein